MNCQSTMPGVIALTLWQNLNSMKIHFLSWKFKWCHYNKFCSWPNRSAVMAWAKFEAIWLQGWSSSKLNFPSNFNLQAKICLWNGHKFTSRHAASLIFQNIPCPVGNGLNISTSSTITSYQVALFLVFSQPAYEVHYQPGHKLWANLMNLPWSPISVSCQDAWQPQVMYDSNEWCLTSPPGGAHAKRPSISKMKF